MGQGLALLFGRGHACVCAGSAPQATQQVHTLPGQQRKHSKSGHSSWKKSLAADALPCGSRHSTVDQITNMQQMAADRCCAAPRQPFCQRHVLHMAGSRPEPWKHLQQLLSLPNSCWRLLSRLSLLLVTLWLLWLLCWRLAPLRL
jgi:hypothetical protein